MAERRHRRLWAELAGVGALALAAGVLERRHLNRIATDPEQSLLAERPSGQAMTVRSADGTALHVEVFGPQSGATFMLVHGWTERLDYWVYEIRELSQRGYRVIACDLRGHGESDPAVDGDYAIARFGEDVEAVLEAAVPDGQRAIVVGHSPGAMSIAAWAERHDVSQRACAAALVNTGLAELVTQSLLIPLPLVANLLNRVAPTALVGSRAPVPKYSTPISQAAIRYVAFGPSATPAQIAFYERMLVAFPPDVRADVGIALSEIELMNALARLTVPTLVVAGDRDRLTPPAHAERIAGALPQLHRLLILDQTGHMAPLERPAAITEALLELAAVCAGSSSVGA